MSDPSLSPSASRPNSGQDAPLPKPPAIVRVTWTGEHRFEAGRPNGPAMTMDGAGVTGPSPVDTLLNALAGCISVDVVDILAKRRTPAQSLAITVTGQRVDTTPRRLRHVTLAFEITGEGIDRPHAERAILLSMTKYCSVRDSLREDITIDWSLTLNGTPGPLLPERSELP